LCSEIRNNGARVFVPQKLFSQNRLQTYLSNKELGFGRQAYESEDYLVYNTIIEAIVRELVIDGIIVKQQKESTPDDVEERYEVTQKLEEICKDFRDSGLSY
jgi:DNA-binding HxlR family transcriptional regulator